MSYRFFDELPFPSRTSSPNYDDFVEALIANAGKWAVLPGEYKKESAASKAAQIKKGGYSSFRGHNFDACTRQGKVFVRYLG